MAGLGGGGGECGSYFQGEIIRFIIMSFQLTINYPNSFPDALGFSREQFEMSAKWAMAVKLFEMEQLSSGMAATLLNVDRVTFLLRLNDYDVAMVDLSEDELLQDLENA